MNQILIILVSAVLASPILAHSESAVGNGGDVVVCRNSANEITSIELLDFYEGRTFPPHLMPSLGDNSLTIDQKLDIAFERLSRLDPLRAEEYKIKSSAFFDESYFDRGIELVDIPDSNHIKWPAGCKVEQIIIAKEDGTIAEDFWNLWVPHGKQYLVNADLWDNPLFSNDNKAGLILHEIIYKEAREIFGHHSSEWSRYYNGIISSDLLTAFTDRDYVSLLNKIRFNYYFNYHGMWVEPEKCEFYDSGHVALAQLISNNFGKRNIVHLFGRDRYLTNRYPISFYDNGHLKDFNLDDGSNLDYLGENHYYNNIGAVFVITVATPDRRLLSEQQGQFDQNGELNKVGGTTIPIDVDLSRRANDILHILESIEPKNKNILISTNNGEYNLDQFFTFGESFLSLSETEKTVLKQRLHRVGFFQSEPQQSGFWPWNPKEELPSIEIRYRPDGHYDMWIYFDNNSGEQKFFTKEQILNAFHKIIRGE